MSARRVAWSAVGVGALGAATTLAVHGATRFWTNWLVWYLFLLTTALGALFLVALEHLVDARWSVPIRRVPERLASLLLPLTPVALVALLSLPTLFHKWTGPEAAHHAVVAGKAAWLNVPFFSLRVVICLVLWLVSYRILVGGSLRQDASKDPRVNVRLRRFAPGFMAIFAFTVTIVAFDWISSLEPEWYSDIFGVYVFAGTFLAGLAATTLAVLWLKSRGRLAQVRGDHLFNLGGLLFAFTVFWSYIGFAQYMLMWYADLPEEIFWYQQRIDGPWRIVALSLALVHFFVPFFALITRDAKSDPRRLARVGALVLFAHLLDVYWLIVPSVTGSVWLSWPELSFALLFLGGALLWLTRAMAMGEDMPVGDAFLGEALEYRR